MPVEVGKREEEEEEEEEEAAAVAAAGHIKCNQHNDNHDVNVFCLTF